MKKSKVENGEVIRIEQEKRFLEWVKARDDDWWEDEARISIWDFRIMQEFFKEEITNALNQQREEIVGEIKKEVGQIVLEGKEKEQLAQFYFFEKVMKVLTKLEK